MKKFIISEDIFEKEYVILRMVTDLNNRLARAGNESYALNFRGAASVHRAEVDVVKRDPDYDKWSVTSYAWDYDGCPTQNSYDGMVEFIKGWEDKLFPKEEVVGEFAAEAYYIEKPSETWRAPVYECSACGHEFMNHRLLPNWCPRCGRALDYDMNGNA